MIKTLLSYKINLITTLLCLLTLTACATVAKFEKRMDGNKGLTKEQLIEKMGIPDKEYQTDNFVFLEYNQRQKTSNTTSSTSVVNGYLINTATSTPHIMWCKLEFKLVNGIVENYRYRGNMCRSQ